MPLVPVALGRVSWIFGGWSGRSFCVIDRHDLTDEEWARLEPLLPDRTPQRGGRWVDHRTVINGVFWRTRAGAPWRDLPSQYGKWQTTYNRHRRWSADGTWAHILDHLRQGCDGDEGREWTVAVDSMTARAHQHAAGAQRAPSPVTHTGGSIELQGSRRRA